MSIRTPTRPRPAPRRAAPRPRTATPASAAEFDRAYWLAHCEGFRVDAPEGTDRVRRVRSSRRSRQHADPVHPRRPARPPCPERLGRQRGLHRAARRTDLAHLSRAASRPRGRVESSGASDAPDHRPRTDRRRRPRPRRGPRCRPQPPPHSARCAATTGGAPAPPRARPICVRAAGLDRRRRLSLA
jgi:hypothetical protein